MSPIETTGMVFWASVLALVVLVRCDVEYRRALGSNRAALLVILLLLLIWRIPLNGGFFYGLEYEDSYIYSVVGRAVALDTHSPQAASFLTSVCSVGSLLDCSAYETYASHYIGASYIIGLANRLWGFAVVNANTVGLLSGVVSAIALWCLARFVADTTTAIAATIVLAVTPVFAIYGVAAFAEPSANAFATIALAIGVRMLMHRNTEGIGRTALGANTAALTAVMSMSVLIKRESAVISASLMVVAVIVWWRTRGREAAPSAKGAPWILLSGFVVGSLALYVGFARTLVSETGEFGQYPFALKTAELLLPLFLNSFMRWRWYLGGAIFVLVGVFTLLRRVNIGGSIVLLSGLGFLMLYVSHVRSHYMLVYSDVSEIDTLRYAITLMSVWSLLAGVGLVELHRRVGVRVLRFAPFRRWVISGLSILIASMSYAFTARLRAASVDDEFWGRVRPAQAAVAVASGERNAYVISAEPLLLQLYGPPAMRVVDFRTLSSGALRDLRQRQPDAALLYLALDAYDTDADRLRYQEQFEEIAVAQKRVVLAGEGFTVYELVS